MLTDGLHYFWITNPNTEEIHQPFVEAETVNEMLRGPGRHCLTAGDGHRIPFPRRVLSSNAYRQTRTACEVVLFSNIGDRRYHGLPIVDYVMTIQLVDTGLVSRRVLDQVAAGGSAVAETVGTAVGIPNPSAFDAIQAGAARQGFHNPVPEHVAAGRDLFRDIFLYASPTAHEGFHWTERIELNTTWGRADRRSQADDEIQRMMRTGDDTYSRGYQANIFTAIVCYELIAP